MAAAAMLKNPVFLGQFSFALDEDRHTDFFRHTESKK
jgi:hypothetical protein